MRTDGRSLPVVWSMSGARQSPAEAVIFLRLASEGLDRVRFAAKPKFSVPVFNTVPSDDFTSLRAIVYLEYGDDFGIEMVDASQRSLLIPRLLHRPRRVLRGPHRLATLAGMAQMLFQVDVFRLTRPRAPASLEQSADFLDQLAGTY